MNKKNLTEAERAEKICQKLTKLLAKEEKEVSIGELMTITHHIAAYMVGVMIKVLNENPTPHLSIEMMIQMIIRDSHMYAKQIDNATSVEH